MDYVIVIPAYNPGEILLEMVDKIINALPEADIVLIDDGSEQQYKGVFEKLAHKERVFIVTHAVNQGKGKALKTGFEFVLQHFADKKAVITADADGQHSLNAICTMANNFYGDGTLILGRRNFANKNDVDIPLRSKLGNRMTQWVFNHLCGIKISDTQTGLRLIPAALLPQFLKLKGARYEYETNCLLWCKENGIEIKEIDIDTIYENGNESSHFNPLADSLKIYSIILKYVCSSLLSTIIDYIVFFGLSNFVENVFILTYAGRGASIAVNFLVNKKVVFKSNGDSIWQAVKYIILVIISGTLSSVGVYFLTQCGLALVLSKVIMETTLFFFNFICQKNLVFIKRLQKENQIRATDWTAYYRRKKSIFSTITQKITMRFLSKRFKEIGMDSHWSILECGGGNSCFAKYIVQNFHVKQYDIADNNSLAIEKARVMPEINNAKYLNLTENIEDKSLIQKYDLVYSIGLVEHFDTDEQMRVIKNHFNFVRPGGYVLISAPTPTIKYRFYRKCMEIMHVWRFWDETPITQIDFVKKMENYGEIIFAGVNKRLPLTQFVVVIKT